jgi:uncharacterized protein YndB with AHSA1/START domain
MMPEDETPRDRTVTLRRRFRAPRAFLFQAWTDPAQFARWFGPKAWTVERCKIDARPGGSWQAWLRTTNGTSVYVGGVYAELERDRRIVFTWDTKQRPAGAFSVVTVEFADQADGVEIRITHRELTDAQAVDMDVGWNNTFDSLEEYVTAQTEHGAVFLSAEEK